MVDTILLFIAIAWVLCILISITILITEDIEVKEE